MPSIHLSNLADRHMIVEEHTASQVSNTVCYTVPKNIPLLDYISYRSN